MCKHYKLIKIGETFKGFTYTGNVYECQDCRKQFHIKIEEAEIKNDK